MRDIWLTLDQAADQIDHIVEWLNLEGLELDGPVRYQYIDDNMVWYFGDDQLAIEFKMRFG